MKTKILHNKFWHGLAWGACLPALSFIIFHYLNELTVQKSLISAEFIGFKGSTIGLFAICVNLIPIAIANSRLMDNFIRGIMLPTMLACGVWFYYYGYAYLK